MSEAPSAPNKARRGCLFYGCITGIVCLIAVLVAFLLGLHELKKMLNEYTDTKPMPLPAVQLSPAEIAQVQNRVELFRDALRGARTPPPLELSGEEIDALLQHDPDFKALSGKLFVRIEGAKVTGLLSVPMRELGLPLFRGRYLNGTATFAISFQNGILGIFPRDVLVKGKPLPAVYMDRIRAENLAARVNENPRSSVALNRLQSIEVRDGKLIIVPKVEN